MSKQGDTNKKIIGILQKSKKPMTAYEILAKIGVTAPPVVYRALSKLIGEGAVHKIESLNAFIACDTNAHHGHVDNFAVCKSCGDVEEIHDHRLEKLLDEWSQKAKFKVEREVVEILGTCGKCSMGAQA